MKKVFGIPNCDSCRKATKWLTKNSIEHQFHDIRKDGLSERDIERWLKKLAWDKLLNTRSATWRGLTASARSAINEKKAVALMLEHPTLIKRPVLEYDAEVLVGFSPDNYRSLLK